METLSESSTSSNRQGSVGSRFKSSENKPPASAKASPLAISAGLHLAVGSVFALLIALGKGAPERIEFEVIEKPQVSPVALNLAEQTKPKEEPRKPQPARKVFGLSQKALTADSEPGPGVEVKQGNTVATAPDNEKLRPEDATSLPIPTDEYLVTKMPQVAVDVRIPYPPEAFQKKIEGKVVMELLIDSEGRVRDIRLLSGPGYGLNEAALNSIRDFKFKPAEVNGKPVAVRIPFTYNFVLKNE